MNSGRLIRRVAIVAGGAAFVAMGALTACTSTTEKDAPSSTVSTPASSAAVVSPSEKALSPTGDNSFTPKIDPTGPGAVCKQIVGGVCVR